MAKADVTEGQTQASVDVIAVPMEGVSLESISKEAFHSDLAGLNNGNDRLSKRITALHAGDTVETARRLFEETEQPFIPIIDRKGRYTGQCASRSQLNRLLQGTLRPERIGGLATPLGVFMTSGYYMSGSGMKGLIATGILFAVMLHVLDWVSLIVFSLVVALFPQLHRLDAANWGIIQLGFAITMFLTILRLTPLAGLHAAEHMTIHAIERDLPLTEPAIRTQPREHIRCGTNLMVLLGGLQLLLIFMALSANHMSVLGSILYTFFWSWIILRLWRPVGLWLQTHFTTKNPTSGQIASAIKAGNELLEKFSAAPHPTPNFWRRLWGSGILQMLLAFILTNGIITWTMQNALGWLAQSR